VAAVHAHERLARRVVAAGDRRDGGSFCHLRKLSARMASVRAIGLVDTSQPYSHRWRLTLMLQRPLDTALFDQRKQLTNNVFAQTRLHFFQGRPKAFFKRAPAKLISFVFSRLHHPPERWVAPGTPRAYVAASANKSCSFQPEPKQIKEIYHDLADDQRPVPRQRT
jgi:hypothetical protein